MGIFQEIHDRPFFDSAWERDQLERNIGGLVQQGVIQEIPAVNQVGYGERWYQEKATGEIYRYVPPEFPAKGVWQNVIF